MRHDHVRNLFAELLSKAGCHGVEIEQHLQPVQGELEHSCRTAVKGDEARMDLTAIGFWGDWQRAFYDVRVFNPTAPSHVSTKLDQLFKNQENEKKRAYGDRIREIEKGSFTPLVFSVAGGCGRECDLVLKLLAGKIAEKTNNRRSAVMSWIRTKLSFTLLRACIVCLRGCRNYNRKQSPASAVDFDIASSEARL